MHIILYKPQIPQNTGNIIRTCVATNTKLTLIEPISFQADAKALRRAGLDYVKDFTIHKSSSLELAIGNCNKAFFFSSKATKHYDSASYPTNATLVFGSETSGLCDWIHRKYKKQFVRIPIAKKSRCLNLSNAVAIALYEALRQHQFTHFS